MRKLLIVLTTILLTPVHAGTVEINGNNNVIIPTNDGTLFINVKSCETHFNEYKNQMFPEYSVPTKEAIVFINTYAKVTPKGASCVYPTFTVFNTSMDKEHWVYSWKGVEFKHSDLNIGN